MSKISQIDARQILDSRSIPTVEATITLSSGVIATSSCPSGASVSKHEALELRDNDPRYFNGNGVEKAVKNIIQIISPNLIGMNVFDQRKIDETMILLDGTINKAKLGANAILPVSMAVAKAAGKDQNLQTYEYLRMLLQKPPTIYKQPLSTFNIINGGLHGDGNIDFQEFMIIPKNTDFIVALEQAVRIYHSLKNLLKKNGLSILLGDEGGFSPALSSNTMALELLIKAIENAGLAFEKDIALGLDVAASSFYKNGLYLIKEADRGLTANELDNFYETLYKKYPLFYIEDPFYEDDFNSFAQHTKKFSSNCIITGDDLISTNPKLLQKAIDMHAITGLIVKVNQIGTVTETLEVIEIAQKNNIKVNVSHRSGETNDDFIADLAIAVNADLSKFGAPARGERVAKYNRLLKINNLLTTNR